MQIQNKKVGFGEIQKIIEEFAAKQKEFLAGVDFVVGVSRGGLVPAALLAAAIDRPLAAVYIDKNDEIFFDRGEWIKDKNILVVDDVIRSGKTLRLVKNHLEKFCQPKSVSFFALFKVKPLNDKKYDIPSFSREIDEGAIFPWD
jgi:hypoxanthine phosphoribosyltransferase